MTELDVRLTEGEVRDLLREATTQALLRLVLARLICHDGPPTGGG